MGGDSYNFSMPSNTNLNPQQQRIGTPNDHKMKPNQFEAGVLKKS
jgi:hypothetical protein